MNTHESIVHVSRKKKKAIVAGRMTEIKPETRGEYCSRSLRAYCHVLDYIITLGRARILS